MRRKIHLLFCLYAICLLQACASTDLSQEKKATILSGEKGALVADFETYSSCGEWKMSFKNLDTREVSKITFFTNVKSPVFGQMHDDGIIIAPLAAGSYVPVSGKCSVNRITATGQSNTKYRLRFDEKGQKPVVIKSGQISYPGSYKFLNGRKKDTAILIDKSKEVESFIKTTHPDLFDKFINTAK